MCCFSLEIVCNWSICIKQKNLLQMLKVHFMRKYIILCTSKDVNYLLKFRNPFENQTKKKKKMLLLLESTVSRIRLEREKREEYDLNGLSYIQRTCCYLLQYSEIAYVATAPACFSSFNSSIDCL